MTKPVRWTYHAEKNLADREIDRSVAEATIAAPTWTVPGQPPRRILMAKYQDRILNQEMLLRVVVEEEVDELVVVTVYKTSHFSSYLKEVVE